MNRQTYNLKDMKEITTVNSLLTLLKKQHPTNHLVVFDKNSNGYCIDDVKVDNFTVLLISNQECIEKTYKHFTITDIIEKTEMLESKFEVQVVINLPKEHSSFVKNVQSPLFLEI